MTWRLRQGIAFKDVAPTSSLSGQKPLLEEIASCIKRLPMTDIYGFLTLLTRKGGINELNRVILFVVERGSLVHCAEIAPHTVREWNKSLDETKIFEDEKKGFDVGKLIMYNMNEYGNHRDVPRAKIPLASENRLGKLVIDGKSEIIKPSEVSDPHFREIIDHYKLDTCLCVPLVAGTEPVGLLIADNKFLPDGEIRIGKINQIELAITASIFADLIDRAILLEEQKEVGEIGNSLMLQNENEIVRRVLDFCRTRFGNAMVRIVDGEVLKFQAEAGKDDYTEERDIPKSRFPNSLGWQIVESGKSMMINDVKSNPVAEGHTTRFFNALAGAPIKNEGLKTVGVLTVSSSFMTERDLRTVELLARLMSEAIIVAKTINARDERAAHLRDKIMNSTVAVVLSAQHGLRDIEQSKTAGSDMTEVLSRSAERFTTIEIEAALIEKFVKSATGGPISPVNLDHGKFQKVEAEGLLAEVSRSFGGIRIEVEPGLPEILGDRSRLRNVLGNLCDNGQKHGTGVVSMGARREGDSVRFFIRDEGRVEPTKIHEMMKTPSGTGLQMCWDIIRQHGGTPNVNSEKGTEVSFTIPVAK